CDWPRRCSGSRAIAARGSVDVRPQGASTPATAALAMSGPSHLAWQDRHGRATRVRTSTPRTERALLRAAQRGSSEAFDELFRRHWPAAHRTAYLVVHDAAAAEDIAQEAFLAVIRSLDRFDRRRPPAPWLHRLVVNRAIDWTRARRLRAEVDVQDDVHEAPAPAPAKPD